MKYRALCAEDDSFQFKYLQHLLAKVDIEAVEAVDGQEAVDLATSQHFDIMFIDILMPRIDGFMAIEKIRQAGYEKNIIVVTAETDYVFLQRALVLGGTDVLVKPVKSKDIVSMLKKYLDPSISL